MAKTDEPPKNTAPPRPSDDADAVEGGWTKTALIEMDARFRAALEREMLRRSQRAPTTERVT